MVFAVNPPRRGNTFWKFLQKAKALAYDDYRKRSEIDEEPEEVSDIEERDINSRITGKAVDSESEE
ncbi:hypothetical protein M407DRAFT_18623 [Tulasnella calospora MUT 4182]|nr:hypothetical protein M407DRAFT_18623 [Tulasnella calospora MUT 4182]